MRKWWPLAVVVITLLMLGKCCEQQINKQGADNVWQQRT